MIDRRFVLKGAAAAVAAPALIGSARAQAQVTLRMHHFLPPISTGHAKFLRPWADKVQSESGGRIKIDIYPSMQLGGAPPALYDQVRDGVVDLVWTLPGYTPGRFPISEAFELPFTAHKRAVVNSKALAEFADAHLANEFREVKPICFWAHDHGLIHANRPVRSIDDLKGLKLRFPTRQAGEALKALGATAVGMPVPQVPESLAQRVIDGCVIPWEVVPAVKVHELVRNHTEFAGSPTFYSATFLLAMNPAKYDGLPADLKAVIDRNSGIAASEMAGKVWDTTAIEISDMVRKRGNTITVLSEADTAEWRRLTEPVIGAWVRTLNERGLKGDDLLKAARDLIAKHGNGVS